MRHHYIGRHLRIEYRQKLYLSPVGIPVAERGVLVAQSLVNLEISPHILPVHIIADIRMDKRTVKVGIELLHTVLIGTFHLYLPKDRIPFGLGSCPYPVEIPSRILRLKIESGILYRDI